MLKRIVTGAVLIPIVVLAVYWAPSWVVAIVAAAVALLATMEFFKLTAQMGLRAFRKWTMVCIVGLFGVQWLLGITEVRWLGPNTEVIRGLAGNYESPEVILLLFVLGCACIGVMSRVPIADVLPAIGASAAGLIFVALPFSYLGAVGRTGNSRLDVGAFYAGACLGGRHRSVFCGEIPWANEDGAGAFSEEDLGRRGGKSIGVADRWILLCARAAVRPIAVAGDGDAGEYRGAGGRSGRISI